MQPGVIGLSLSGGKRVVRRIKAGRVCVGYDAHTALFRRLRSRGVGSFEHKLMPGMRDELGGRAEKSPARAGGLK
jgi:6-phosphogluconate dehydrogenase (decarboxylating)